MDQQTAWNQEYGNSQGVPTSTRTTPSSAVTRLLSYISEHEAALGHNVIDLGCGIGRNALHLARNGFNVTGVDFAQVAIDKMRRTLVSNPQEARHIMLQKVDLGETLPFPDNSYDLAIDIVTTMTLTPRKLVRFENELRRIIKPGGLFLTYVLSDDDGFLEATNPGQSFTTVEESGITDNYFSKQQLQQLYQRWEFLMVDKVEKVDQFYGRDYTRRIWWILLKKTGS